MKKFLILCISLVIFSCTKTKKDAIPLDLAPSFSLSPTVSWLLVTVPYARVYEKPGYENTSSKYYKRGEIYQIYATSFDEKITWYKLDDGWVDSISVKVYSNRYKAEKEMQRLKY
ncbi:MAG: hypothetical protein IKI31_04535 [Treponema sp.]|nr:hypothetical protein [Treponema sp.]